MSRSSIITLVSGLCLFTSGCDSEPLAEDRKAEDCPASTEISDVEEQLPADSPAEQAPRQDSEISPSASYLTDNQPVEGSYRDMIRRVVRAHINEVRHCYSTGLDSDPTLSGRVVVNFTISPDGDVAQANLAESSLVDEDVGGCIVTAVARWKFPKPSKGSSIEVNYPFVLSPSEDPSSADPPKAEFSGDETALSGLSKDVIRRIVRAHINEVRHCYNEGLSVDPELAGRVVINFRIPGDGRVDMSAVQSSTLSDESVGSCIATAIKGWKFPKTRGGGSIEVSYPFVLEPG